MAGDSASLALVSSLLWTAVFAAVKVYPSPHSTPLGEGILGAGSLGEGNDEFHLPVGGGSAKLPAQLQLVESLDTPDGVVQKKFRQLYRGREVFGTVVTVSDDRDSRIVESGKIYTELETDLSDTEMACEIDRSEAIAFTLAHFWEEDQEEVYKTEFSVVIFVDSESKAHHALLVDLCIFTKMKGFRRLKAFVDQCDGTILDASEYSRQDQEDDTGVKLRNPSVGEATPYKHHRRDDEDCDIKGRAGNPKREIPIGTPPYCLGPLRRKDNGTRCTTENVFVRAVDLKKSWSFAKRKPVRFNCLAGYNSYTNGGYSPLYDVFLFGTATFQMFSDWYGYKAYREKDKVFVKARFGRKFENAFWDGESAVFGDGNGKRSYPWTNLDTVAHELGHAVLDWTANLWYSDQSGGMNEAFADIVGEVVEQYLYPEGTDWLIGAEIFLKHEALRYFDDPTKDRFSIKHVNDYQDGMNVHATSGIYNHAFWKLSKYIGIRPAFESIFYAVRNYWGSYTNFEEGYCGVQRAAYHLGYPMENVRTAFDAVGINGQDLCPNLASIVTTQLKPGKTRGNLKVSEVRNPLFWIRVKAVPQFRVDVQPAQLIISVSTSWERASVPLAQGPGTVVIDLEPSNSQTNLYFVRLYSTTSEEVPANVTFNVPIVD